ncbi:ATP-binding cassette sub-family A member 1-like protein [Dinothrombium tinctorium]|uniref:ATP-binding cassette sub-family A member 1-like protein n=1 Tax=Dinothrombium tinctorium TaxID=1965070 RepID=A0A3S3Q091_9ACAR|nr:ATP-binding cassette sub-family A member 1-like protein [Dinothrombium tinctorium]
MGKLLSQISDHLSLHELRTNVNNTVTMLHTLFSSEFKNLSSQLRSLHNLRLSTTKDSIFSLVQLSTNASIIPLLEELTVIKSRLLPGVGKGPVLETVTILVTGLQSLKHLADENLFTIVYKFRELIKNADAVKLFLEYHLGIESTASDAILNATIDLTSFAANGAIEENLLCNRSALIDILHIPRSEDNMELISFDIAFHSICTLSIAENYKFTQENLKQLTFKKIFTNFVTFVGDELLTKANLRKADIPRAMKSLEAAAKSMPKVKGFVESFTSSMGLQEEISKIDWKGNAIDLLGSPEAAVIAGKLMCGKSLPVLKKEFSLLKVSVKKPKINQEEIDLLKGEFCRDGYKQIMHMEGGAVVWSFLKPFLKGKVLYTPKNDVTDEIMSRLNGTFSFISGFINILQRWAQTVRSLEMLYKDKNSSQKIESVKHEVVQLLGRDVEGLFKDNDTILLLERLSNSGAILNLIELVGNVAQCFELQRFVGYENEYQLEQAAKKFTKNHELICGIVFLNFEKNGLAKSLPPHVEYKIRADIDFVPSTKLLKERIWEPGARDNYVSDLGYLKSFVQIQEMIDKAIISIFINKTELDVSPALYLQQFPYPCYKEDKFGLYVLCLIPVIATIAWIFLIGFLIRDFVLERELHLEEVLRVAGLKPSVAWLTWFILGYSVLAFGSLCGLFILWLSQLLPHSNLILIYLYFMAFSFSIIMYSYLISCFFKVATIASLSGIVVYLASFLPFMVAITLEYEMTFVHKLVTCLSMSTSFCFGIMYTARYEAQGVGIQWSNIWRSPMTDDTMNFATAGIMMIVDGLIYFLIAWYISNVFPAGNNSHHQPWYFFILPSYWGLRKKSHSSSISNHLSSGDRSQNYSNKYFENEFKSWQRRPGMSLHNLYVVYDKGTKCEQTAVANLNLELKEGQITTLLGRNGAGKTTTISVLTGQLPPTSGSVFIYGHPVPEQFVEARKLLGYCPQYNVLFNDLSIREHLRFYSHLKGLLPEDQIEEDIDTMLQSTGLWQIQHELAKSLSGGLQRRLCVALAFVGGSKLIILDEPTSSVDPVARRNIWDLIVNQKQSRTVLLTTHHLDEADILSDQVAVIHRGKLLCNGSPLLLKSTYGCGYQLTVSKQALDETNDGDSGRASNEPSEEQSDSERLLAFTKCLIPNSSLIEEYNSEVVLALPPRAPDGRAHDYSTFFRCLDANLRTLGFSHYGLRSTTLEEVFITLCSLEEANLSMETAKLAVTRKMSGSINHPDFHTKGHLEDSFESYSITNPPLITGIRLKLMQLSALISKRKSHAIRDWKSICCSVLLPCIFIAFAMGMSLIKPTFAPDPILPLTPIIYGRSSSSFFSEVNNSQSINEVLDQLLHLASLKEINCGKPRKGWRVAKCPIIRGAAVDRNAYPEELKNLEKSQSCNCEFCSNNIQYPSLKSVKTEIGHMYNLSGIDVSQFLLTTFAEFNDRRFGGFTFHRLNNRDIAKVWFENSGFHAVTSYLNAVNNAILRANLKKNGFDASKYLITTYSHPFHIRSAQLGDQSLMQRAGDAGIALIILVGFVFIPTSVVFYIVKERTQEEKQLQRIFGIGTFLYWFSAMLWDMLSVIVAVIFSAIIIVMFQLPIYTARLNLFAVMALLLCFGWAMISIVYLMEKLFHESSIAFMVIYCLALFVGMNTMVMRLLIDVFKILEVSQAFKSTFESVALVLPPYALLSGLVDITRNQLFADIFTLFDQDTYINPFSMEMLGCHYYTMLIEGAVLFILNLFIEYICFSGMMKDKKTHSLSYINEDSDVAEERRRVTQTEGSRFDVLRVVNMSKVFNNIFGKKIAVDHITFAIPKGEMNFNFCVYLKCFGLLGVNGAGKTTLFKILTGQMRPSSGEARINNQSIRQLLSNSCQFLGYCPQADALDSVLTPREHLKIYAKMRGIPSLNIPTVVIESIRKFQLTLFSDIPVKALSRGTKRKLCLAIAMLGNPQIMLLDEPTSGMDPLSRRCLWQNIQAAVRERRSVVLTSHSMEECDILCSRLAIMVNGRFCCIGSPHYLKHKFGTGYTITLRLCEKESNWNEAIRFIKTSFPSCVLRAHHHNMLEFSLPTNNIALSTIFDNLQEAQKCLHFLDFSVTQTTLDQVFVSFANNQNNDFSNASTNQQQNAFYNEAFVGSNVNINQISRKSLPSTAKNNDDVIVTKF